MKEIEVFLENCKLFLKCGVYEEERKLGVETEVSVYVKSKDFVDYQKLYEILLEAAENEYVYLEEFIENIFSKVKSCYREVFKIDVKVSKRSLPFQNSIGSAGVRITWEENS